MLIKDSLLQEPPSSGRDIFRLVPLGENDGGLSFTEGPCHYSTDCNFISVRVCVCVCPLVYTCVFICESLFIMCVHLQVCIYV